jgi:hypothetical protein
MAELCDSHAACDSRLKPGELPNATDRARIIVDTGNESGDSAVNEVDPLLIQGNIPPEEGYLISCCHAVFSSVHDWRARRCKILAGQDMVVRQETDRAVRAVAHETSETSAIGTYSSNRATDGEHSLGYRRRRSDRCGRGISFAVSNLSDMDVMSAARMANNLVQFLALIEIAMLDANGQPVSFAFIARDSHCDVAAVASLHSLDDRQHHPLFEF